MYRRVSRESDVNRVAKIDLGIKGRQTKVPFESGAQTSPLSYRKQGPRKTSPENGHTHSRNLLEAPGAQDTPAGNPRTDPTPLKAEAFAPELGQGNALWPRPPAAAGCHARSCL